MCVSPLQQQYGKNKSCSVPSGGECKQIYIENVNIGPEQPCYQTVLSFKYGGLVFMTFTKSVGLKEHTYKTFIKLKIWTVLILSMLAVIALLKTIQRTHFTFSVITSLILQPQ